MLIADTARSLLKQWRVSRNRCYFPGDWSRGDLLGVNLNFWFREMIKAVAEYLGHLSIPPCTWMLLVLVAMVLRWFRGLALPAN